MDWTAAEAALETAAASVFDRTAVRILPRKEAASVNQARVADPDRAAFDALTTIELGAPTMPAGSRMSADPSARGALVQFEAVMTAHVAGWPYVPVRFDRVVERPDTDFAVVYEIVNVDRDGSSRPAFYLNRTK